MGIRMTGLQSGLDTEGIIKELMSAKSLKKTKLEQNKTKLEWTKDKWAELNTKIYNLYREQVSKMRLQSAYNAKKASSSNESVAKVTADATATNGTYRMEVSQVATSQYLTGAKVTAAVEGGVKATTKLSDIDASLVGKEVTVTYNNKTVKFQIRSDSTITDYLNTMKSAGLNASYDEAQQRFFISGAKSGAENAFSITTSGLSSDELAKRSALEDYIGYDKLNSANKAIVTNAYQKLAGLDPTSATYDADYKKIADSLLDVAYTKRTTDIKNAASRAVRARLYVEKYDEVYEETKAAYYDKDEDGNYTGVKESYAKKYGDAYDVFTAGDIEAIGGMTKEEYIESETNKLLDKAADKATIAKTNSLAANDADVKAQIAAMEVSGLADLDEFSEEIVTKYGLTSFEGTSVVTKESVKAALDPLIADYANLADRNEDVGTKALESLGMADIVVGEDGSLTVAGGANGNSNVPAGMALIGAQDSVITLNGAELTASESTIKVNGMSIELVSETKPGEALTFTVSTDSQGIYDSVKSFVTQYNELVTEMNKLYNADKAKGYEPLTEEEREAMSDSQVELWETKIKDSLLRRDTTLGNLMSSMRTALSGSVEVDGKKYSLSSFGVVTSSDYTENGLLHIYGDKDDATYADNADKLLAAIESDPELVTKVFSTVMTNLYELMQDKMATSKVSSTQTFYNDKKMKSDIEDYEDQIKDWTERLEDMEDTYYDQFSAMEVAMSKLNSQLNSMSALFSNNSK